MYWTFLRLEYGRFIGSWELHNSLPSSSIDVEDFCSVIIGRISMMWPQTAGKCVTAIDNKLQQTSTNNRNEHNEHHAWRFGDPNSSCLPIAWHGVVDKFGSWPQFQSVTSCWAVATFNPDLLNDGKACSLLVLDLRIFTGSHRHCVALKWPVIVVFLLNL